MLLYNCSLQNYGNTTIITDEENMMANVSKRLKNIIGLSGVKEMQLRNFRDMNHCDVIW